MASHTLCGCLPWMVVGCCGWLLAVAVNAKANAEANVKDCTVGFDVWHLQVFSLALAVLLL